MIQIRSSATKRNRPGVMSGAAASGFMGRQNYFCGGAGDGLGTLGDAFVALAVAAAAFVAEVTVVELVIGVIVIRWPVAALVVVTDPAVFKGMVIGAAGAAEGVTGFAAAAF